ncbi:1-aminocyclopropane-1-carboxylate deaminase [Campylobacter geochelonis]|uniref:1-aminocyclopropane-1-carboxylate deaminase n=1 Tax=Campylobacter geochelonis TaxID=1780362 RepID=A0A128EIK5_9BACT|nr:1-aminocyclopropane-1-carboxylate deaminase [Campylobacter geochelonis]QKF71086.1 1-aminocyclopropane-1-carboxylate deaminase [Campylobacter geochelonis]CZE47282.1 1-aminocyclopropane-1-carboxylate deaminase [Campylobacter geochelonis]CZE48401.1 1-aminocyclopropane-1-carboxylate deaminase [Campylobacter geochelonis]
MIETKAKIDKIEFSGFEFYLLRDDLLGEFNGNKARKLAYLLQADLSKFNKIVSFGSSQSNAMYSISVFAKLKGLEFEYVMSHLSSNLATNPVGNFKFALENGMKIFVEENRREFALSLCDEKTLFIEEGVAQPQAEFGFIKQARDIEEFARQNLLKFDIFLPSGTGTSAAYLAKHTKFDVFTTPCVGDETFLKEQIQNLDPLSKVKILPPSKKYHFGDLKLELFKIWHELKEQSGVEFDLIYDPVGFLTLLKNFDKFKNPLLYIHQGGLIGNISQLQRYKYKFKDEIV